MLKKHRHNKFSNAPLRLLRQRVKKGIYVLTAIAGIFYAYYGLILREYRNQSAIGEAELEISMQQEQPYKNFKDFCKAAPSGLCTNQRSTDFLYDNNKEIAIVKADEFNAEFVVKALKQNPDNLKKIASLMNTEVSFDITPQDEKLFTELETDNQTILDQLYEEELPDNVIDEDADNEYTHINHKSIKDIQIMPDKKPFYFGEYPMIAIVIDDMGISQKRTFDISKLHAPLTASFLTYGRNLNKQVENSIKAGHEIMIHTPMEPQKNIDVAPDTLTTKMSAEELKKNLTVMLDKFEGVKGINNHMGSKLTEDEPRMEAIMKVLKEKHLFFLDSKTSAKSQAETAAKKLDVAYAHRHVFLDNNNDKAYILNQLAQTERLAAKNGYAIAIGHPKSQTYEALKEWIAGLENKKIKLVHLSNIIKILNPHSELAALERKKI